MGKRRDCTTDVVPGLNLDWRGFLVRSWVFGKTVILTGENSFLVAPVSLLMNH